MCDITCEYNGKSAIGYKVVAKSKKNGRYYSLAMGFQYSKYKDIPIVKVQKRIAYFNSEILTWCFSKGMEGRTAVFENQEEAKKLYKSVYNRMCNSDYEPKLVKVELTKDLMRGTYYTTSYMFVSVVAGRRMKILEEIEV